MNLLVHEEATSNLQTVVAAQAEQSFTIIRVSVYPALFMSVNLV